MDSSISYKRNFIVLDEESDIFRADNQKAATGYAKIEDRGIKTKISVYIQDLLPDEYKVYCICAKNGIVEALKCTELTIDKNKKADVSCETMSNGIFEKKYSPEDIVGISIVSKNNTPVLEGFKGQKFEYKIEEDVIKETIEVSVDESKQEVIDNLKEEVEGIELEKIEEIELEKIEEQKIEEEKIEEEKIEDETIDDAKVEQNIVDFEDVEEEVFNNMDEYYIPFENADIKMHWIKKHHSVIDDKFSKKIFSISRLYYLSVNYKHYIVGEDNNKLIIGVPANYNSTYIYIKNNFGDSVKWVPINEEIEDYGYWLFFIDKD